MAESQDVNTLKRRGRRRLVGAIALVLLAAIVLPMVFDPEPKFSAPPVSVRIPGEDDAGFAPKAHPKVQPPPAVAPAPAPAVPEATPVARKTEEKPVAAASTPEASKATAEQYVIQVGAFADPAGVIERLKAAKLPYYTEPVAVAKGKVTRVRVGPFADRKTAQKAHDGLRLAGLKPGDVVVKP